MWLQVIVLCCSSKKGISAHQIHRMLGITYKAAFFMLHRIRYAMEAVSGFGKLKGEIEIDEMYHGGRRKNGIGRVPKEKVAVMALVQRGGDVHSFPIEDTTARTLVAKIKENVDKKSMLFTDQHPSYEGIGYHYEGHKTINHSEGEFVRGIVSTNTIEGYFSLFKRGVVGIYHHVSVVHLPKYLAEFNFRYNSRKISDGERAVLALKGFENRRLTYKEIRAK